MHLLKRIPLAERLPEGLLHVVNLSLQVNVLLLIGGADPGMLTAGDDAVLGLVDIALVAVNPGLEVPEGFVTLLADRGEPVGDLRPRCARVRQLAHRRHQPLDVPVHDHEPTLDLLA